jgi:tetratricopeptide (TPR) repeat protein
MPSALKKLLRLLGLGTPEEPARILILNDEQHLLVYRQGADLIDPYMLLLDRKPRFGLRARANIRRGIALLEAVTAYAPGNWPAYWMKGKGYQALGERVAAKREFAAAFAMQKSNPDVAREYGAACLETGDGQEALDATEHAIRLTPNDPGLHANAALALLTLGRYDDATVAVDKAIAMDNGDQISLTVRKLVGAVKAGKRPQPKNMADMRRCL